MLGHLALQTKQHHGSADGDRLAIMERPTIERYRTFLGQIYCFEAPIEAALVATDGIDRRLLRTHLKSAQLAADLEALGLPARELLPREAVHFDSPGEALGWLWVLHRNTLVHGLIYRYLCGRLAEPMRKAGAYLSVFEGRAGALMRELGDVLDATANRSSISARIVIAANEAFRLQRQWYSCETTPTRQAA